MEKNQLKLETEERHCLVLVLILYSIIILFPVYSCTGKGIDVFSVNCFRLQKHIIFVSSLLFIFIGECSPISHRCFGCRLYEL